jgi:hypothetical protein
MNAPCFCDWFACNPPSFREGLAVVCRPQYANVMRARVALVDDVVPLDPLIRRRIALGRTAEAAWLIGLRAEFVPWLLACPDATEKWLCGLRTRVALAFLPPNSEESLFCRIARIESPAPPDRLTMHFDDLLAFVSTHILKEEPR